jgi:hypothetical protein
MGDVAGHMLHPKTQEAYKSLIKHHIKPVIRHIRVSALPPSQVQKFYADRLSSGLSKRTVQLWFFLANWSCCPYLGAVEDRKAIS